MTDEVLYPKIPAATPQPPPTPGGRVVLDDLITLLRARSEFGERKYGTRLTTHNGRDAYLDALQEVLDLVVYLHQAQMEHAELGAKVDELVRENASLSQRVEALYRRAKAAESRGERLEAAIQQDLRCPLQGGLP